MPAAHTNLLRVCTLAVLTTLALSGCGGARERYSMHLQRGRDYLAAGNLDKADIEFRNAIQIEPKGSEALYASGGVAEQRGNPRAAAALYQAAIDADPNYELARAGLGKILIFAGATQRALDTIAPALMSHPENPDLLAVRAAAHHQLKDDAAATADAEHAVRIAPANENAIAILAALKTSGGDRKGAIALVLDAVARAPASSELREVLTNLYLAEGERANAEEQMYRLIELNPHRLAARAQLASHFVRVHDIDAAQRVLEDAVQAFSGQKDSTSADQAKLLLVDLISSQRSSAEGQKVLRGYIARTPDDLDLRLGLAALLRRTGASKEAIAAYREVIARDGKGARGILAADGIAAIQLAQGDVAGARKSLAEVLEKSPRDDEALTLRATLELRANDANAAIADLRAVLRNRPDSVELQRSLAGAYLAKGDNALAEETLRAAMQSAPHDVSVRIELAQLLARTARPGEGVTVLQDAVHGVPESVPARQALIEAYLNTGNLVAARDAAEELKTRYPREASGFYYAGLIAAQEKDFDTSRRLLEHALELQPQAWQTAVALARIEAARGSYDAAVARLQPALAQNPSNIQLLDLMGVFYLQRRDFEHANEIFSRESTLAPRLWQAHSGLAQVKADTNDPEGALREYQLALQLAPNEPSLILPAASLYEKQGNIDAAIHLYEALYQSDSGARQVAANNLAMLLVTYKKDRVSLDRARDLTSTFAATDNSSLLDTVGWVSFNRGEYQDALKTLERAHARAPDSKVIRYHLGMTELQLGLRDRARSSLESALSGAGDFEGAKAARIALNTLKGRA